MNKFLAIAALGLMSAPAMAADLGGRGGMKDDLSEVVTPSTSIGGFYADFGVGGSFNKSGKEVSTTTTIPYYDERTYSNSSVVYDTGVTRNGYVLKNSNIPTTGYIDADGYHSTGEAPASATTCTAAHPCYVPDSGDRGFRPAPVTITNTPITTGYIDTDEKYHTGDAPTGFEGAVCTAAKPCSDYKATVTHSGVTTATGLVSKTTTAKHTYGYSGVLSELRTGYDFKMGSNWFIGPLLGVSYDWASDSGFQNGFGYKAGARLGYQLSNVRLFAESGYAGSHVSGEGFSHDASGVFFGGGVEAQVSKNAYIFTRVDWEKDGSFSASDGFQVDNSKLTAMVGIGIR